MKILYLTSRFPYPLEKGDKLRAYYQIASLAKDHEVHLISVTDVDHSKSDLEKLKNITSSIHLIRLTTVERYISLMQALTSGLPFQIAWFFSHKTSSIIEKLACEINPDHVFCQLPRMALYGLKLPFPKTLDYMDSFGIGMKRRAMIAKGLASWLYMFEAKRMIEFEKTIAKKFDHLTIISQQDKEQFNFQGSEAIKVISNGISQDFFEHPKSIHPAYDIVFVGNMNYLPNIESVEFLVKQILPRLPKTIKVLIAGASPSPRVKQLESNQTVVSGWISDIRTAYASGRIFVAPMWSGTGQQNKILEAMAMSLPCITTKAVNNAIGAQNGKEILLAENVDEFVCLIKDLLQDEVLYNRISKNCSTFVRQNFDWNQNSKLLSAIFASK